MPYARIVNIKYKSEEDVEIYFQKWEEWCPKNMPVAVSRTNVRTGANSTLLMAVNETEQIAEEAREAADKFFKMQAQHIHDVIEFHGEVLQ